MRQINCENGVYFIADNIQEDDIDESAVIGPNTKIWADVKIFQDVKIGKSCILGAGVHIESGVKLGDFCKVQRGVTLYSGVEAEDYVFFGPNATTTNDKNPRAFGDWDLLKTKFETGSSIGANATVVAGVKVGTLALVGAGSVVTKDVEPCSLVVGNPARRVGWVDVGGNVISHNATMPNQLKAITDDPIEAIKSYIENIK